MEKLACRNIEDCQNGNGFGGDPAPDDFLFDQAGSIKQREESGAVLDKPDTDYSAERRIEKTDIRGRSYYFAPRVIPADTHRE